MKDNHILALVYQKCDSYIHEYVKHLCDYSKHGVKTLNTMFRILEEDGIWYYSFVEYDILLDV